LTTFRKKARWSENLTSGRPQSKLNEVRVVDPASRIVFRAMKPSIDRSRVTAFGRGANARAAGVQPLARTRRRAVVWLLASAMAALGTAREKAAAAERHKHSSAPEAKRSAAAQKSERNRAAHQGCTKYPPAD
jgi:hypothetical protein